MGVGERLRREAECVVGHGLLILKKMPFLIPNILEKRYTPYTARLAPKHHVHIPQLGRLPQKQTRFSADPTVKSMWRFIRRWLCHNTKLYYTYVLGVGALAYSFHCMWLCTWYKRRNYHRSLEFAIIQEKEWAKIKPKDDEDEEEDEEEEEEEEAPAAAADAPADDAEGEE